MDTTKNYGLKQWDGSDRILRTDFNENNLAIEAALDEKQESLDTHNTLLSSHTASISSLTTGMNNNATSITNLSKDVKSLQDKYLHIVTGSYVGDATEGRSIDIGTEVAIIFVYRSGYHTSNTSYNLCNFENNFAIIPAKGYTYSSNLHGEALKHTGSGFDILNAAYYNYRNVEYFYTAIKVGD